MKKRRIFGVIAAQAADIEQREILSGAIEKAQSMNIDIAVISNIYNPIETAVSLLDEKLRTSCYSGFEPPKGKLICGDTCPCGAVNSDIKSEIKAVQIKATYDFLNLFSQLEHRLTECRNIDEFVTRCRGENCFVQLYGLYFRSRKYFVLLVALFLKSYFHS